jgi:hypothetical protein
MAGQACRGIRCGGCGEPLRQCKCSPEQSQPGQESYASRWECRHGIWSRYHREGEP